jgi:Mn-dependent DtxR family transcriptional regulator
MPSSTEEDEEQAEIQIAGLRLKQVLDVFKDRRRTTPKQLGRLLGIESNTACEHLRRLERLGLVRRVGRGLYVKS